MLKPDYNTPCFFTQQLFLIGTKNEDGSDHFAPISWISYTFGEPSCLVISMYGSKQTKRNLERTGEISATIVTQDMLPFIEANNGANSEPEKFGFSVVRGNMLNVPLLKDTKFSYECKLYKKVEIGETSTYFMEIKKVNVSADVERLEYYDLQKINPVIYGPDHYYLVGEHLGEIGDFSK